MKSWIKLLKANDIRLPTDYSKAYGEPDAGAHTRAERENSLKSLEMVRMNPQPRKTDAAVCLLYITDMEEPNRLMARRPGPGLQLVPRQGVL